MSNVELYLFYKYCPKISWRKGEPALGISNNPFIGTVTWNFRFDWLFNRLCFNAVRKQKWNKIKIQRSIVSAVTVKIEQITEMKPIMNARTEWQLFRLQIEREFVLSSGDKNSKIPILHEYKQRTVGRVAIAPDAPIKQQAWVQEVSLIHETIFLTHYDCYRCNHFLELFLELLKTVIETASNIF